MNINEQHGVRRSIAIVLFAVIGLLLFVGAVFLSHTVDLAWVFILMMCGTAFCCAGLVYTVLVRREHQLTGPGLTGTVLSGFGFLLGILASAGFACWYIFIK